MGSKYVEERSTTQYEDHIRRLEAELRRAKIQLKAEKIKIHKLSSALKHNDRKYKKQQEATDTQLAGVISKLMLLEGELRREQQDIEETLQVKDKTISWQGQRVSRLERINMQLKNDIAQLREKKDERHELDTTVKSVEVSPLQTLDEEIVC